MCFVYYIRSMRVLAPRGKNCFIAQAHYFPSGDNAFFFAWKLDVERIAAIANM